MSERRGGDRYDEVHVGGHRATVHAGSNYNTYTIYNNIYYIYGPDSRLPDVQRRQQIHREHEQQDIPAYLGHSLVQHGTIYNTNNYTITNNYFYYDRPPSPRQLAQAAENAHRPQIPASTSPLVGSGNETTRSQSLNVSTTEHSYVVEGTSYRAETFSTVVKTSSKTVGIEVAGLILSVLPVVVKVVDWSGGGVRGRDAKFLAESLKNDAQILSNSIEFLLRSLVQAPQVHRLLNDLSGDAWKDESFNAQVKDQLGRDADIVLEKLGCIYSTVLKLQEKLPTRDGTKADAVVFARAKHVIKSFIQGPQHKTSLDRLNLNIGEFRTLTDSALNLASVRSVVPKSLKNLKLVREWTSGLFDALQDRCQCDCGMLHAHIKLEGWPFSAEDDAEKWKEDASLKISFFLAKDVERKHSSLCITAETTCSKADSNGISHSSIASPGATSHKPTAVQSGSSAMRKPVSSSSFYFIPAGMEERRHSEGTPGVIQNLCCALKEMRESAQSSQSLHPRKIFGTISNGKNQVYQLYSDPDQLTIALTRRSIKWTDLINRPQWLSPGTRTNIALMLACGLLQLYSTPWLSRCWTKDNILLVEDGSNKFQPYISLCIRSPHHDPYSSLEPKAPDQMTPWIRNVSLFNLAVFLLELCYNRSIEDMANDTEKNEKGDPYPHTPFLTVARKAKEVQDVLGIRYAQAVSACLHLPDVEMDVDGNPKSSTQFAKAMLRHVIEPLKTCADQVGS